MQGLAQLSESSSCKSVKAKENIVCTDIFDDSASALYILLLGEVGAHSFVAHKETKLEKIILPSGFFGARDYFTGNCDRQYIALKDSVVYAVSEATFPELAYYMPKMAIEIYKAAGAGAGEDQESLMTMARRQPGDLFDKIKSAYNAAQGGGDIGDVVETGLFVASVEKADDTGPPPDSQPQNSTAFSHEDEDSIFPKNHKGYPGITKPEYKVLTYEKEFKCIYCKKMFKADKVFLSKLFESQPARFDMRKFYKDFQLEWYDVYTCPHCYYTTLAAYYDDPKAIMNAAIEEKLVAAKDALVLDFEAEKNIDFVFTQHYLALMCAPANIPRKRQIAARMWSGLSWLYEDVGDKEMELFAAEKAARAYEAVYSEDRLTPGQEQIVCMAIAGMLYRAGIEENLKKYILRVKSNRDGKKAYVEMAENLQEALSQKD